MILETWKHLNGVIHLNNAHDRVVGDLGFVWTETEFNSVARLY